MIRFSLIFFLMFASSFSFASLDYDWVKINSGSGAIGPEGMNVDASGNIYTTGNFSETFDFDPGAEIESYTSETFKNMFIQKLDSQGDLLWINVLNNSGRTRGIEFDSDGNVLVVGTFKGTMDFDSGVGVHEITAIGDNDFFILKLNPSGEFIWAKNFGGESYTEHVFFTVDKNDGSIYLTGGFNGSGDFDSGAGEQILTSNGLSDFFILKLDSAGDFQWIFSGGGLQLDSGMDVALDSLGNVYTVVTFRETTIDFEPGDGVTELSTSSINTAILKLNPDGQFEWVKHFTNGYNSGKNIVFDSEDNFYVPGVFQSTVGFGASEGDDGYHVTSGLSDAFLAKVDKNGNTSWTKTFGGTENDGASSLVLTPEQGVLVVGGFSSATMDFDPGEGVTNLTVLAEEKNLYMSRFDKDGNFIEVDALYGSLSNLTLAICMDKFGSLFFTGSFNATTDFDPSEAEVLQTPAASYDGFVLKLVDIRTNLPPDVIVSIKQRGDEVTTIFAGAGAVDVTVTVDDPDSEDAHTIRWYLDDVEIVEYRDIFEGIIPSNLIVPGDHVIKLVVEDNGDPVEQVTKERLITVVEQGNKGSFDLSMVLLLIAALSIGSVYQRSEITLRKSLH